MNGSSNVSLCMIVKDEEANLPRCLRSVQDIIRQLVVVDTGRLGAIGRTLAVVRAARAEGLHVAAVVLSQIEPSESSHDDPASPQAIAIQSASDLAERLRPVPVTMLAHHATAIEPDLDWLRLARSGGRHAVDPTPP